MLEDKSEMCITCEHYEEFAGVCCNPDSENRADFTDDTTELNCGCIDMSINTEELRGENNARP